MQPKWHLEIGALRPVVMVFNKPLLGVVRSFTPHIKRSTLRDYRIVAQLRFQHGKPAFVCIFFIRPDRRFGHESYMRLHRRVPSSSPMLPRLEPTWKNRLWIFVTGAHTKHFPSRHSALLENNVHQCWRCGARYIPSHYTVADIKAHLPYHLLVSLECAWMLYLSKYRHLSQKRQLEVETKSASWTMNIETGVKQHI